MPGGEDRIRPSYFRRWALAVCMGLFGVVLGPAAAPAAQSGPYCGVQSLYAAMVRLGKENVQFADLLKPQYIGSRQGSSLLELKKAAEDHGLYCLPVEKMNAGNLRACRYPIILHVKADRESIGYDHYELFVGVQDGQARLYDPPEAARLVPFHQLAARWDGSGLVLADEPISGWRLFLPTYEWLMLLALLAVIAMIIARAVARRLAGRRPAPTTVRQRAMRGLLQAGGLVVACVAFGLLYNYVSYNGLLAYPDHVADVQFASFGSLVPRLDVSDVRGLMARGSVTIVDARERNDFEYGHIAGSINVPTAFREQQRAEALAQVPKDAPVVVYCQSSGCPYAGRVGARLWAQGYRNISIMQGGWVEWQKGEK